jgi:hypothetical protein
MDVAVAVASTVREQVLESAGRFWRPQDFEGSPDAVDAALARLANSGVLNRLRRGLYWRGEQTRLGMAPPDPFALATALVGSRGVGLAGASAALQLGLTTQLPIVPEIATPTRPPSGVKGITFRDRSSRFARRDEGLSAREVAFLEVLEDWDDVVDVSAGEAIGELVRLLCNDDDIDVDRLTRAAIDERPLVRERLRALLTRAGFLQWAREIPPARDVRTKELGRDFARAA